MVFDTDHLIDVPLRVRRQRPLIHAITNWVTANEVANCLHAIGARPILAWALEEVEEITAKSDALVLNLGTPSAERIEAMILAGKRANQEGRPVVFDPVGAGGSKFRTESSKRILSELRITVIRGNQAEIGVLEGREGRWGGVDAISGPDDLEQLGYNLALETKAIVVATGPWDLILSLHKRRIVENGHPMMGQITGMGCMLTAVIAAFNAVADDPMVATVSAVGFFGLAGELAGLHSLGPGSFKPAFFDALSSLTPDQMRRGLKLKS
ncbi:MAG: hydroxyethylthiazole kinase [Desulfobacterota bacterium]|nr:hydroxyethylthiazole kinase [Thermodesulfobacteriota bacterium]